MAVTNTKFIYSTYTFILKNSFLSSKLSLNKMQNEYYPALKVNYNG